jgi:NAD(P)-dependent dehydrogenase (short-subunit alcohol dehydrogenase family)
VIAEGRWHPDAHNGISPMSYGRLRQSIRGTQKVSGASARRVCVVTGGASGLGREVAESFAGDGSTVVVVDRDADEGDRTVSGLVEGGADAYFRHADVSKEDQVEELAEFVSSAFDGIDVLVNNAGLALREGSVIDMTRHKWDLVLAVNLTSVFLMSHHLLPVMRRGGSVVNVATTGALRAVPGTDAYLAAKGGVIALSKAMAVSLADRGIRVNVVCPFHIQTEEVARRTGEPRMEAMVERAGSPLGRGFGQPGEFAGAVRFLCSAEASYINGVVLPIDGGVTA